MARSLVPAGRSAPGRRSAGRATATGRLSLLEYFVGSDDATACAEQALQWLARHVGVERAVCLGVNSDMTRLVGLTALGVPVARLRRFSVALNARDHPLVGALAGTQPVSFPSNGADPGQRTATPFGTASFLAYPLHGLEGTQPVPLGLLLVATPLAPAVMGEVRWVVDVLSQKLFRLRYSDMLAYAGRMKRLHAIINAVPDPVLLTDAEGRLVTANTRAEGLLASREDDSEGRRRAVALNNMLFSSALGQTTMREALPERRELLLVDPTEGSDLLFELMSTVVGDAREGLGIVSVLRNVTDLRRATEEIEENYGRLRIAEAEVRAERDRLDLIIDSVADPIVVTDPGGNIVLMNAPADRLFTLPPDAAPEEVQRVQANDANFTSFISNLFFTGSERRWRGGISLVDPTSGASIPVEAVSGKILSESGEVSAVVTILHDRTEALEKEQLNEQLKMAASELEEKVRAATAELVRQNELLRRQAIELEQASAAKTQFLANMSHEFRTPLNAILGYTSMLLKGIVGELSPRQRDNLGRVDSNSRHLLTLINDILDISRIEAGRMPLHVTEFAVSELIAEVMGELEPIIVRSRLDVTSDAEPGLPTVRSDRAKVKQIVLNLLTNALKFTPEGGVRVSTRFLPAERQVAVAVADTGIGIAPADQSAIFEDFRQADASTTRQYGGAGLGLAICRRLATMLEGQITLESKAGAGSTFTLFLPHRLKRR
ncbi:MAG: ATP-binding protein [Candidatus Rokuibacteriota bacterium]